MQRTNIYLTEPQTRALKQLSARTGMSCAELVRRAIDAFIADRGLDPRMRNKRDFQRAFWGRFGGTWDEQCVFRIPQQERERWVISDTSRWDFEKWP